jgi:RimJ/RimL family protein N-acetyltransferase
VRLRALTFEDWEEAYPSNYDSEARFLLQDKIELPPVEATIQEEYRKFADFNREAGRLMFTIETLDGIAVGGLNLNTIDERNGTFSIGAGIWVGYRVNGYGTAAMRILLRYAFLERRLHKFNSGCVEGNVGSTRMHEKLGCVQEGVRRQMYYSGGRHFDGILFGLTKDEFVENERRLLRT